MFTYVLSGMVTGLCNGRPSLRPIVLGDTALLANFPDLPPGKHSPNTTTHTFIGQLFGA